MLSPSLSSKSYDSCKEYLNIKKYPVHKALIDYKTSNLDYVIEAIKKVFTDIPIEVYLFGSYINSMYYDDIDMAVVAHINDIDCPKITQINQEINQIKSQFINFGIDLDITLISTDDIISNRCVHLIEHVRKGFFRVSSTPHSLIFRQKDQRFSFFKYNFF